MVAPAIIGAGISAAGSLLGGLFGQSSQEKMAKANIALQKEFAQKGIQWKAADALKAGIHPLYAMGAQTHSFAPVSVGDSLGPAMASAGQDIGRAVGASMSPESKVAGTLAGLSVERAGLENELLRSQIRNLNVAGTAAGVPDFGTDASDPYRMAGVDLARHPGWSDASVIQNRLGEPAEWLYFPMVATADAYHNSVLNKPQIDVQQGRFNRIMDAVSARFGW